MARTRRGRIPMMNIDRAELRAALDAVGADGWFLFDFHGLNPVAARVLGLGGMGTRRLFVLLPKEGEYTAVAHKIELTPLQGFPGKTVPSPRCRDWQDRLGPGVKGK